MQCSWKTRWQTRRWRESYKYTVIFCQTKLIIFGWNGKSCSLTFMSSLWSQCFSLKRGYLYNNKYVSIITSLHLSEIRLFVNVTLLTMSHGGYIVMVVYEREQKVLLVFFILLLSVRRTSFVPTKKKRLQFYFLLFPFSSQRHSSNIRWNMYIQNKGIIWEATATCLLFFLTPRKKFALETETYIGQPGRIWNEYDYFYDIVSVVC